MGIYALFAVSLSVFSFFRSYVITKLGVESSRTLHNRLLKSVLEAPMMFFDTTPVGRIVARFSKDLNEIDVNLSMNIAFTLLSIFTVIASLSVIVGITYYFATFLLPLCFVYYKIMNFYRNSARELKRLDSVTRSPIYAHFSATLGGLSTIRAYSVQQRFMTRNEEVLDRNDRANYSLRLAERWLSIRLEIIGNFCIIGAGVFAVLARGSLYPGLAGLSLQYAMGVTTMLGWTVRSIADLENNMNSVERILYYTDSIEHEKPRVIEGARPLMHHLADEKGGGDRLRGYGMGSGHAASVIRPGAGSGAWTWMRPLSLATDHGRRTPPSCSATARPACRPSSWKPEPNQAPANQTLRRPCNDQSSDWAATAAASKTGCS